MLNRAKFKLYLRQAKEARAYDNEQKMKYERKDEKMKRSHDKWKMKQNNDKGGSGRRKPSPLLPPSEAEAERKLASKEKVTFDFRLRWAREQGGWGWRQSSSTPSEAEAERKPASKEKKE